jgi:NADH dehydrogenase/NADH:ubiquinone oxidoreductase subunit G
MRIFLDGQSVSAEPDETILDVAARQGIDVPTLCHLPNVKSPSTSCLVCLVKVNGRFVPACATKAEEGMNVESETDEVQTMRRTALELLMSDHIAHCRECGTGRLKCRLLKYMAKYRANRHRFGNTEEKEPVILKSDRIIFDSRKCIKCGICVSLAQKQEEETGLAFFGRGFETKIGVPFDEPLQKAVERSADEIVAGCPTAALTWR